MTRHRRYRRRRYRRRRLLTGDPLLLIGSHDQKSVKRIYFPGYHCGLLEASTHLVTKGDIVQPRDNTTIVTRNDFCPGRADWIQYVNRVSRKLPGNRSRGP